MELSSTDPLADILAFKREYKSVTGNHLKKINVSDSSATRIQDDLSRCFFLRMDAEIRDTDKKPGEDLFPDRPESFAGDLASLDLPENYKPDQGEVANVAGVKIFVE